MSSRSQNGRSLIERVEQIRELLRQHPELFEVSEISLQPPLAAEELATIERDLGVAVPEPLRDMFLSVASRVVFHWSTVADGCNKAGYREEIGYVEATLHILDPREWRRPPGIVVMTADHFGNGWALDQRWGVEPLPLVWYDHTSWDGETEEPDYDSFEEMWAEYAEYAFVSRPNSSSDLVWRFVRDGVIPDPKQL